MCFVWISEQTAIISLYNINWLVFITQTQCLLRGKDWVFSCDSGQCSSVKAHASVHVPSVNVLLLSCYCNCQTVHIM